MPRGDNGGPHGTAEVIMAVATYRYTTHLFPVLDRMWNSIVHTFDIPKMPLSTAISFVLKKALEIVVVNYIYG